LWCDYKFTDYFSPITEQDYFQITTDAIISLCYKF